MGGSEAIKELEEFYRDTFRFTDCSDLISLCSYGEGMTYMSATFHESGMYSINYEANIGVFEMFRPTENLSFVHHTLNRLMSLQSRLRKIGFFDRNSKGEKYYDLLCDDIITEDCDDIGRYLPFGDFEKALYFKNRDIFTVTLDKIDDKWHKFTMRMEANIRLGFNSFGYTMNLIDFDYNRIDGNTIYGYMAKRLEKMDAIRKGIISAIKENNLAEFSEPNINLREYERN
jgi:hypothetical protein